MWFCNAPQERITALSRSTTKVAAMLDQLVGVGLLSERRDGWVTHR